MQHAAVVAKLAAGGWRDAGRGAARLLRLGGWAPVVESLTCSEYTGVIATI